MMIEMLKAKIHRAVVTEANLEYKGSITIDEDYMDEVGIFEYEKVHVVNLNNGARIETYAIKGERGSDTICLNGAAARYFEKNDKVIIMTYAYLNQEEVKDHEVKVKLID
ncbi:MAG: aspartate 1-decarboxylase [Peptostreptococcaceae bacterium]|nr:aspartate 1-decarboxylase [Peptostreptococcaceae bacterium]